MSEEIRLLMEKAGESLQAAEILYLDIRFHRYLMDAQDFRNLGDYSVGPRVTQEQVEDVLKWTQEFLAAAEEYLTNSS